MPVEPLRIGVALLCDNMKTFEDAQIYLENPLILDILILWNVIQMVWQVWIDVLVVDRPRSHWKLPDAAWYDWKKNIAITILQ